LNVHDPKSDCLRRTKNPKINSNEKLRTQINIKTVFKGLEYTYRNKEL
jgi:hypothetical protein